MEEARARELIARERERIERAIAALDGAVRQDADEQEEPGGRDSEALYEAEFDSGRAQELQAQLDAVARAEERLEQGTYGLSIESGTPIPDARLEAVPTAERTVEEEERRR
jgi:DnaK suppressor protein